MIKKLLFILIVLVFMLGCASKRYAKKGLEFEQAGMYDKATEMYLISVKKNPKNVDAQVGLKKNGQLNMDQKLGKFLNFYNGDHTKDAVYKFLECKKLYDDVLSAGGTELNIPGHYKDYYSEVKDIYLQERYNEAYLLLEEEKFSDAERIFIEILYIQPGYQDVEMLKNTAHFEPKYRQAKEYMAVDKYRKSYYKFQEILQKLPNYKDSKELSDKALMKAMITIAILDFQNQTSNKNLEVELRASVQESLIQSKFPFIKVIDRENTNEILAEQLMTLEGNVNEEVSAQAGKMLGAKALLTGAVLKFDNDYGKLKKTEKKAYIKEKVTKVQNGEKVTSTIYHKTTYNDYKMDRWVSCTFQFKLVSAETGEIMVSDVISYKAKDAIHYAVFDGNKNNLVPGHWENKNSDSEKDEVKDNSRDIRKLKSLLRARQEIESMEKLKREVKNKISYQVTQKIENYDPEK